MREGPRAPLRISEDNAGHTLRRGQASANISHSLGFQDLFVEQMNSRRAFTWRQERVIRHFKLSLRRAFDSRPIVVGDRPIRVDERVLKTVRDQHPGKARQTLVHGYAGNFVFITRPGSAAGVIVDLINFDRPMGAHQLRDNREVISLGEQSGNDRITRAGSVVESQLIINIYPEEMGSLKARIPQQLEERRRGVNVRDVLANDAEVASLD